MSNYTVTTNFGAKDSLPSTDAGKVIKGSEFTNEFTNIQTAIATKADTAGDTFTGAVTFDAAVTLNADVTFDTNTLFIDVSANKVGIGNTSPAYELDVTGSAQLSGGDLILRGDSTDADTQSIRFENVGDDERSAYIRADYNTNSSGNATSLVFGTNPSGVDGSDRMVIDNSGNVGIGTTAPSSLLHLKSSSAPTLKIDDSDSTYALELAQNDVNASVLLKSAGQLTIGVDHDNVASVVAFQTRSDERMRIDSSGKVGIGTASPSLTDGGAGLVTHISDDTRAALRLTTTGGGGDLELRTFSSNGATIFNSANGELRLGTNATERMRIDPSGNVGIGTTSFTSKFHVGGNMTDYLYSEPAGDSIATFAPITTGSSSAMNVNIGSGMYGGAGVETARLNFLNGHGNDGFATGFSIKSYKTASATATDEYLAFEEIRRAGNTGVTHNERMRIDSSGNVGIGTTSPDVKLDVTEAYDTVSNVLSNGSYAAKFSSSGSGDTGRAQGILLSGVDGNNRGVALLAEAQSTGNAHDFVIATSSTGSTPTERMRIDSSGNVGIGTASPDRLLDITDDTNDGTGGAVIHSYLPTLELDDISGGGTSFILQHDATNTLFKHDSTERMRISSVGNLLVGKTTSTFDNTAGIGQFPDGRIYITRDNGNCLYLNRTTNNGPVAAFYRGNVATNVGTISISASSTSYNTSSDERLKENITDSADAGSKVDAIQIRQFDWKVDGLHQNYGVIAQELVTVAPEAVHQPEDSEDMMGVDYSKLVPMLIKEVQSLRSRVAELENV